MIYTFIKLNPINSKMEIVENYGNLMKLCRERIFTNIDIMLEKKRPSERTTKARLYEEILKQCKTSYKWECCNIVILYKNIIKSEINKS